MEMVYYTIAAVVLYMASDYILNTIEMRMGKRLPSRSVIFLIIITILAMGSFSFIRAIFGPLPTSQQTPTSQVKQIDKVTNTSSQVIPAAKETKK